MKLPEILSKKTVARSRLFKIETLDLLFSNGVGADLRKVTCRIKTRRNCSRGQRQRRASLNKRVCGWLYEYQLSLPKGAIDDHESAMVAGARELAEEVGFGANNVEFVKTLTVAPGHMGYEISVVFATDLYPNELEGDEPEPIELIKWPISELDTLIESDDFREGESDSCTCSLQVAYQAHPIEKLRLNRGFIMDNFVLPTNLEERLITLAREASSAILDIYNTDFDVETKTDSSPLTLADMAAHKIIVKGLSELTPDIPIISEESVLPEFSERSEMAGPTGYWIPLDGTKEFVNRNGEFTVNIALIRGNA